MLRVSSRCCRREHAGAQREPQALLQIVEPLRVLRELRARMRNLQALRQRAQRQRAGRAGSGPSRRANRVLEQRQRFEPAPLVRHGRQRGGRRRGRAHVGDEVGDGDVDFVADAGHRRNAAGGDRARHAFVVEAPEVFERAAAARDDQHVAFVAPRRGLDRAHDFRHRGRALHGGGIEQHGRRRKARAQHSQYVVNGRAGGRGDHADAARHRGQRPLALGGEQSFGGELGLELLELALERAFAGFLEVLDQQLVFAARLVQTRRARGPAPPCRPWAGSAPAVFRCRHMAQRTCAPLSFSEKYQWPEAGAAKFESSPSSHSSGRPDSSSSRTSLLRRETV